MKNFVEIINDFIKANGEVNIDTFEVDMVLGMPMGKYNYNKVKEYGTIPMLGEKSICYLGEELCIVMRENDEEEGEYDYLPIHYGELSDAVLSNIINYLLMISI